MKNCKIENCDKKYYASGYCSPHYQRMKTGRKIDAPLNVRNNDNKRFMFFVKKTNSCWEWTGAKWGKGYGKYSVWDKELKKQKSTAAHRYSYEMFRNKIKSEMQIDHLCMNKICVNPQHLEEVTNKENQERAKNTRGHYPIEGREKKLIECLFCKKKVLSIMYERRKYCSNSCKLKYRRLLS